MRALEARGEVEQRVHELDRELTDAEDDERRVLGDALVDGTKPPARYERKVKPHHGRTSQKTSGGTAAVRCCGRRA
jgi:hypothetical protein